MKIQWKSLKVWQERDYMTGGHKEENTEVIRQDASYLAHACPQMQTISTQCKYK